MELDRNIPGHDLVSKSEIISAEECRTQCQTTPGCTAWTWLPPSVPGWENKCYLKGEGGAQAKRSLWQDVVSGLRDCKSKELI